LTAEAKRAARVAVFLDRDGVINRRAPAGEYIRDVSQFEFTPGAVEALAKLNGAGASLFIVTNQRGVARGLVAPSDLAEIHARMSGELAQARVTLSGIYVCPHEIGTCTCRKPDVGLFEQARDLNPWIVFGDSHLVGDSMADIKAGHQLGMRLWVVGDDAASIVEKVVPLGIKIEAAAASIQELVDDGALLAAVMHG
jgi:histidinol-phosphate phosphatase family protein